MRLKALNTGIIEVDLHGMTKHQAKICIDNHLKKANSSIYRIRIIHGFHGGTELKDMIQKDYRKNNKVVRVEIGLNPGTTDLVLREL